MNSLKSRFASFAPVALFAAVPEEIEPLLIMLGTSWRRGVNLSGLGKESGVIVWHAYVGERPVVICLTGMGNERAKKAAQIVVKQFYPWSLLSCGFTGGLIPELKVGDIVGLESLLNTNFVQPEQNLRELFLSLCDRAAEECLHTYLLAGLSTSKVVNSAEEKARLHAQMGAQIVDMEASGIAGVASESNLPWFGIKVVSDVYNQDMPFDFSQMLNEESGQVDKIKVMKKLFWQPQNIPGLCRMAKETPKAAFNLSKFLAFYLNKMVELSPVVQN